VAGDTDPALVLDRPSAWSNTDLWDREYTHLCAIPSSYRTAPSHSFVRLEGTLKAGPGASVLDAGCGTGRHALHLARMGCSVHAVDVSGAACEVLRARASVHSDLARRITVEHALLGGADLPDARYDIVLDSYVSCHLLSFQARNDYLDGLRRLLRPGGVLYTSCVGADDEYYKVRATRSAAAEMIATDPLNGVTKFLQPRVAFGAHLSEFALVKAVTTERFLDAVGGSMFRREVLAAAIQG
jgi:SAM-dependent methyltransferase